MGIIDNAKETLSAVGEKVKRETHDLKDKVHDKKDEIDAESEVRKAEADRDAVKKRNDVKESVRDS
jgi:hypothetical protein